MTAETMLLDVRGLCVGYGSRPVLQGVDLCVGRGEVVAVVGASGAGKSALLRALLGLLPDEAHVEGQMRLDGQDRALGLPASLAALRGRTLALVPQDPAQSLPPHRPLGAILAEALRVHRPNLPRGGRRVEAVRLLHSVGLDEEYLPRFAHTLSGGQGQRALLALALAGEPTLLLADEPTSALDPVAALGVLQALRQVASLGRAVLLVSHDFAACARVADRMVVLAEGRVVESAATQVLLDRPIHPYASALVTAAQALRLPTPRPDGVTTGDAR